MHYPLGYVIGLVETCQSNVDSAGMPHLEMLVKCPDAVNRLIHVLSHASEQVVLL